MNAQFAQLSVNTGNESPCHRHHTALLPGSSCSSPDCWEQGSSCSSASSSASWRLDAAPSAKQPQPGTGMYSELRVLIPGASTNDSAGSSPMDFTSSAHSASLGSCSVPSTPGRCVLLAEPAILAGNRHAVAGQQGAFSADEQQRGGCLSSRNAARRLLASNGTSTADVSNWLTQQVSIRQCARSSICSMNGPVVPELARIELLGAAAGGFDNKKGLPRPAFQLLGLL